MRAVIAVALFCPLLFAEEDRALKEKATELAKRLVDKDPEARLSAIRESGTVYHRAVVSPLIKLLKDKDKRIRSEAIASLGMRDDPKNRKIAAKALAGRLKPLEGKEKTREELLLVVSALHDLAHPITIKALLDMKIDADPSVASARTMAVGNVASKEAIERLIAHGDKSKRQRRKKGRGTTQALAYATQAKVSGGIDQWRKWWKDNKAAFDVELAAEKRANKRAENEKKSERRKNRAKKKEE